MRQKSSLEKKIRSAAKDALVAGLTLTVLSLVAWESFMHSKRMRDLGDE